jgi:hypothetical protein
MLLKRGEKMLKIKDNFEKDLIQKIGKLPEIQKREALNYIEFLIEKFKRLKRRGGVDSALRAVEDTWGTINLNRRSLKYIAEDKELEYEI